MCLAIATKIYMHVANPMSFCCSGRQGWKCGGIQQIVGFILYVVAHGQLHRALD